MKINLFCYKCFKAVRAHQAEIQAENLRQANKHKVPISFSLGEIFFVHFEKEQICPPSEQIKFQPSWLPYDIVAKRADYTYLCRPWPGSPHRDDMVVNCH